MIPARSWISALLWLALAVLATGCAKPLPAEGLRPLPLLLDAEPSLSTASSDPYREARVMVDSLQPRFQWETFPRPEDLKADKGGEPRQRPERDLRPSLTRRRSDS
jgi:hypothetical protein